MSHSPLKPWKTGQQPEYTAFSLSLNLCLDKDGNLWSDHTFSSPFDEATAASLPQGAIPQVAHGLLTEAVRREAFQVVLIQMTKDPLFLSRWAAAGEKGRAQMSVEIERATTHVIRQALTKMVPGAVAGVLTMLAEQVPGVEEGT